jgi:hypothetical protein
VHQPAYDCRSARGDDEEPKYEGEPGIWLEPADDPKQYGSDAPDGEYVNVNEKLHSDVRSRRSSARCTEYTEVAQCSEDVAAGLILDNVHAAPPVGARTEMDRLRTFIDALRVLAKSDDPHRSVLVERHIDEYLRTDPFSLAHALERLCRAIQYEEVERREGEDWSLAKECSLAAA